VTPPETPPPSGSPRPPEQSDADEGGNPNANIIALVFVVVLALGCLWLFNKLHEHNEVGNCIASGRRDCVDLVHPN
jgi:hypothetical protein